MLRPRCRSTIGILWYNIAWQRIIRDATMCHSTEIEELISSHHSPAFYKYSKALCSLPPSFLLLSLFSSLCMSIFSCTLSLPHLPFSLCSCHITERNVSLVCLGRRNNAELEQNHLYCLSFVIRLGWSFPPDGPVGLFKVTVFLWCWSYRWTIHINITLTFFLTVSSGAFISF